MHDSQQRPTSRPSAGRTRNELARRAILEAALELGQQDLSALTVDRIAARAGVGKQTIYRWWPSKWAVVLDALLEHAEEAQEGARAGVTGSTPDDLAAFLASLFTAVTASGGTAGLLTGLMARAQLDPDFAALWRERFILPRRQALIAVLVDDENRGRVPTGVDAETTADLLFGAMWYRLLVGHAPLDTAWAGRLVRAVVGPQAQGRPGSSDIVDAPTGFTDIEQVVHLDAPGTITT